MLEPKPAFFDTRLIDELLKGPVKEPLRPVEFGKTALVGFGYDLGERDYTKVPGWVGDEARRGTEIVAMDARGEIIATPGEEKRIATFGLGGCTAVAVALKFADGNRKGYVQHYSPLNKLYSAERLAEAVELSGDEPIAARVVIMAQGEWAQSADHSKMKPSDEMLVNLLEVKALKGLGLQADVQTVSYSGMLDFDKDDQGTLMIEFLSNGETRILADGLPVEAR